MARAGMENMVSKAKQWQISGEKMVGEKMVASKAKMVGEHEGRGQEMHTDSSGSLWKWRTGNHLPQQHEDTEDRTQ